MAQDKITQPQLLGHWVHAHEEDSSAEMVFRPASHPLPPARGRIAFKLQEDGTCDYLSIARNDRHEPSGGNWNFDEQTATLSLDLPDGTHQIFSVISAEEEKLVVTNPSSFE